jgi:hypothetical protein
MGEKWGVEGGEKENSSLRDFAGSRRSAGRRSRR